MTAAELAEKLHASAGGVSGAVRYLVQVRLIRTERDPGTRRHVYVVDGSWYEATVSANPFLVRGGPTSKQASPSCRARPPPTG
jgi:DNA-binding transcriptional regulator GbsR (MarR family)